LFAKTTIWFLLWQQDTMRGDLSKPTKQGIVRSEIWWLHQHFIQVQFSAWQSLI